jgi:uncharacterized protein (DUF58 family)
LRVSRRKKKDIFDEEFIRKLEYWSLLFKRLYGGELSAARRSKEVGSGIEFSDRREYLPGDDFRYVDWKALGRMDRAFVRLFVEEKDLKVNVIIDSSASMDVGDPPKIESAVKLGAVLAYMVLFNLDRVALTLFSEGVRDYIPPARGKARIRKILDKLRGLEAGGKTDLKTLASAVAARDAKPGLVIMISDLMVVEGFDESISRLIYNGSEVCVIRVLAEEDRNPRLLGEVRLQDSETGAMMAITATPRVLARYKAAFSSMSRKLEQDALKRGVRFVTVHTSQNFDDQVSTVLRAMAKRK